MRLFHFTGRSHLEGIQKQGLTKGSLVVPILEPPYGRYGKSSDVQWLTDNPSFEQEWGSRVLRHPEGECDRMEMRFTFKIPNGDPRLRRWLDFAEELIARGMDRARIDVVNGLWKEGEPRLWGDEYTHWWVYGGTVPARWISNLQARPVKKGGKK